MQHSRLLFIALACVVSLTGCTMLSGCFDLGGNEETVVEPPFIPAPEPAPKAALNDEVPAVFVGTFSDLEADNSRSRTHSKLMEAVAHAIHIGVLKPTGIQDRFNPQDPVQYDEFRRWVLAYQNAAAGVSASQTGADGTPLSNPMSPANLKELPETMQWGAHQLKRSQPVTREELCALYVFLAKKDAQAAKLSPEEIEAMAPGGNALNTDEALSQFKDYTAISTWAKPYVAIAYRESIPQTIFGLTSTALTIDEGFRPGASVTRGEAIMLLHRLYRHVKAPPPRQKASNQPATMHAEPGMQEKYSPADSSAESPIKSISTVQESGPQGSRSASRTVTAP